MRRPISVQEAAKILGITDVAVMKRISRGKVLARPLSSKGLMVCHESVIGEPFSPEQFEAECKKWISVPEACDIVCVTDGMIGRMLADGRLKGWRLSDNAWAVSRKSCEDNMKEYLANPPKVGRPRLVGERRSPKKKPSKKKR